MVFKDTTVGMDLLFHGNKSGKGVKKKYRGKKRIKDSARVLTGNSAREVRNISSDENE